MTARTSILSLALGAVLGCAEPSADPTGPTLELVDISQRLDAASVNAHTYGSFVITAGGSGAVIRSGPANFPGNPKGGPGTCEDGLWINSNGKRTAGSLTHPHPHCVSEAAATTIVLEPISSRTQPPGQKCEPGKVCEFIEFSSTKAGDIDVNFVPGIIGKPPTPAATEGTGTVVAYAIDAATLGTTNRRVGTITFALSQYTVEGVNLFGTCALDDASVYQCLPLVITAKYEPLAVDGVGDAATVTGFIWWAPASTPYNY